MLQATPAPASLSLLLPLHSHVAQAEVITAAPECPQAAPSGLKYTEERERGEALDGRKGGRKVGMCVGVI